MRLLRKEPTPSFDQSDFDSTRFVAQVVENKSNELPQKQASPKSIIGAKITLKGELTGDEDLLINGRVQGLINLNEHSVNIGVEGVVQADIKAGSVMVDGCINGDIEAENLITVKSGSNVNGHLLSDRVQLDDGARFSGNIEMK